MKPEVRSSSVTIRVTVTPEMTASLDGKRIHPLYSTFWLAYHAEVAARKAIEPYFDEGENAVGAGICLEHCSMCPIGAVVAITAQVVEFDGKRVVCTIEARTDVAEIARGTQIQVLLPTSALKQKVIEAYANHHLRLPEYP